MSVTNYSKTAASNTAIDGTDISEGCSPAGINNAIRSVMKDVASMVDATTAITAFAVDNLKLDGNTLSSTDTNGNIVLDPNGTGSVDLDGAELILDADGDTSITADTDDRIDFKTAGTDRMHITSSGDVGIGVSSPARVPLHVHNPSTNAAEIHLTNTTSGSTSGDGLTISQSGVNASLFHREDGYMRFATNNAERMRIDSGGRLMLNTTSNIGTRATINAQSSEGLRILHTAGSTRYPIAFQNGSNTVGSISTSQTSTTYNTSSDHRLKENAVDMTGAITRVKSLQPKRFNFIIDDSTTVDGFMAHEAATVVPEAVTGTHNEVDADGNAVYQGIDQAKLVPLLTGALREAITKIETLETEMTALKARVATLENA